MLRKEAVEHEGPDVPVVEEITKLVADIAEIDVEGNSADLEARQHGFEELDAVEAEDAHVIAGGHADLLHPVCQAVGALIEPGERASDRST